MIFPHVMSICRGSTVMYFNIQSLLIHSYLQQVLIALCASCCAIQADHTPVTVIVLRCCVKITP